MTVMTGVRRSAFVVCRRGGPVVGVRVVGTTLPVLPGPVTVRGVFGVVRHGVPLDLLSLPEGYTPQGYMVNPG